MKTTGFYRRLKALTEGQAFIETISVAIQMITYFTIKFHTGEKWLQNGYSSIQCRLRHSNAYSNSSTLKNMNEENAALLIGRLKTLEYEIRKSITVREDQEDNVDLHHVDEAKICGITVEGLTTKGDLLNAVQTALRAAQAEAGKNGK